MNKWRNSHAAAWNDDKINRTSKIFIRSYKNDSKKFVYIFIFDETWNIV